MGWLDLLRLVFFHDCALASSLGRELVCIAAMFALLVASPRGWRTETREPVRLSMVADSAWHGRIVEPRQYRWRTTDVKEAIKSRRAAVDVQYSRGLFSEKGE